MKTLAVTVLFLGWGLSQQPSAVEERAQQTDSIEGTVVNSVTHEPIARALVVSTDNQLATMTDAQGRFEITVPRTQNEQPPDNASTNPSTPGSGPTQYQVNGSYVLMARKPGYLGPPDDQLSVAVAPGMKDVTVPLVPEALIAGQVLLPNSQPPEDKIQLQIYKREVEDGRAHWRAGAVASSNSKGEFRFSELRAGQYKLFTLELMDRDPQTSPPGGQLYGYPPVYYPNATDFRAGGTIVMVAGQRAEARLTLARRPYYPVKLAIANAPPGIPLQVMVSPQPG